MFRRTKPITFGTSIVKPLLWAALAVAPIFGCSYEGVNISEASSAEIDSPRIEKQNKPKISDPHIVKLSGKKLHNGAQILYNTEIDKLIEMWKSKKPIVSELPEEVKTLINVTFYKAYGFDLPEELNVRLLSDAQFTEFFGPNNLAMYAYWGLGVIEEKTIYLRESPFNMALILAITHELGHGVYDILYAKGINEYVSWWMQRDLLLEMEGLLPPIGKQPFMIFIGFDVQNPVLFSPTSLEDSVYPFLAPYGYKLPAPFWETERKIQNEEKIDNKLFASHASWILLGTLGSFEAVRAALSEMSTGELKKLVKQKRTSDEFYELSEKNIDLILSRLMKTRFGRGKNQALSVYPSTTISSTLKLAYSMWCGQNFYERYGVPPSEKCDSFAVNINEANECYGPFPKVISP